MPTIIPGDKKCRPHSRYNVQSGQCRPTRDQCNRPPCGTIQADYRNSKQQSEASQQTRCRYEMPPGTRPSVLTNHGNFPETILKILQKEVGQAGPRPIPGDDLWRLPDLSSGTDEAQVQFVVLIATKRFVEQTYALQGRLAPAAIRNRVYIPFIFGIVKFRASTGKLIVIGERDRLSQISFRARQRRTSDIIGVGFAQNLQATVNVVGRIFAVSVHSNDNRTSRLANGGVQSGGDNFVWIIDHAK